MDSHSPVLFICIETRDGSIATRRSLAIVRFKRTCSSQKGTVLGMEGPQRKSCKWEGGKAIFIATVYTVHTMGKQSQSTARQGQRRFRSTSEACAIHTPGFLGSQPAQDRHQWAQEAEPGTDRSGTLHHGLVCNLFYSVLVQSDSSSYRRKLACSFEFGYCLML